VIFLLLSRLNTWFCYRISLNNSRVRSFLFSHQKWAIIRGPSREAIISYIYILFTGSRALNILFHFPIKSQNNRIKETEHELFKCSKFGFLINAPINVKPARSY